MIVSSKKIHILMPICLAVLSLITVELGALEEYGSATASTRILIASESTRFKNQLVKELVDSLDNNNTYLRVIDHRKKELDQERASEYSAVVIINSGVNSQVRPWVTEWLRDANPRTHIVLLTTYRDRGWEAKYPRGVDSITSPSKVKEAAKVAHSITQRVERIVNN